MNARLSLLALMLAVCSAWAQQPLTRGPVHRYTFGGPSGAVADGALVLDTIGMAHAAVRGGGASATGTALRLPGGASSSAAYIDLPNGVVSGSVGAFPGYATATYEVWVTVHRNLNWSRILDFGSNELGEVVAPGGTFRGTDYLIVTANIGGSADIRLERGGADFTGGGIQDTAGATALNSRMHLAVTYDGGSWRLYRNGALLKTLPTLLGPETLPDVNAWLGRSNWAADSNTDATYDEFRIYDYALNDQQVLGNFQAGPDALTSGPTTTGPVIHYKYDETSGITAADASGNGNPGTLSGGASFTAGLLGNALFCNGSSSAAQTANAITLPNPSAAITVAAWIRPTTWSGGNRRIVQKGANNDQFRLYDGDDVLRFEIANPARVVSAPLPALNSWTHVAGTYDGATLRLYVNGMEAAAVAASGGIPVTSDALFVGTKSAASPSGERFSGLIDDVWIYDRALAASELAALSTVVTITATDGMAQMGTSDGGAFTISRTGPVSNALTVPFQIASGSGQALLGQRYLASHAQNVSIAAGQDSAVVNLLPTNDHEVLGSQSVSMQLEAGEGYELGVPNSAVITLLDSPVNVWKILKFGSIAAAQGAAAGDTADADGDGLPTLVELAMNKNPLATDAAPFVPGLDGEFLTLTFSRMKNLPVGIAMGVVWSYDLESWSTVGVGEDILADDGATQTIRAKVLRGSEGRRFLKVRVVRQ